jgi:hypothetical protein
MKEPGRLSDLEGAGLAAWEERLVEIATGAVRAAAKSARAAKETDVIQFVAPEEASVAGRPPAQVDWSGFPQRGKHCLRNDASVDALLDWRDGRGDIGRNLQEEYLEWRCVRDAGGRITRIEFTTETPEYWETLAAYHPVKALRVIGRFAGERIADPMAVYGVANPAALSVEERRTRFRENMAYPPGLGASRSHYNNGLRAITFMAQQNNTLSAAITLAAFAARQLGRAHGAGGAVPLTGPLAIANTRQSAVDCRSSDPTIVGAVIELCWQGRKLAIGNPPGIYILGVDPSAFLLPDRSAAVPVEWFDFQRGARAGASGGLEMSQRLVFEVPPGMGFVVGDLIDQATDEEIRAGAQVARHVRVGLHVLASEVGAVAQAPTVLAAPDGALDCGSPGACGEFKRAWAEFQRLKATKAFPMPAPATHRGRR